MKEGELPADEDDLKKDEEVRLKILNWIEKDHPGLVQIAEGRAFLQKSYERNFVKFVRFTILTKNDMEKKEQKVSLVNLYKIPNEHF